MHQNAYSCKKTTPLTAVQISSSYNKAFEGKAFLACPLWVKMDAIVKSIVQSEDYSPSLCILFVCYLLGREKNTNQNPGSSQALFVCPYPSYTLLPGKQVTDIFIYYSGRQALLGKKKQAWMMMYGWRMTHTSTSYVQLCLFPESLTKTVNCQNLAFPCLINVKRYHSVILI